MITLTVRPLERADLVPTLAWSGGPGYLGELASRLDDVERGEMAYLAVVATLPVGLGGVVFGGDAGCIMQLAVLPALQSQGVGTMLIAALEAEIAARGLARAELDVEIVNPRARALYERLGYTVIGEAAASWPQRRPDGTEYLYETTVLRMARALE
ncbi:N-acetyltransferase GCN5 [Actinorhabdospora filicis]|uniref:N-acetyltransferase GCN5 n=1 Tax=Actinorhabdospora filicis TaxID=1785913 RepID=A0A9W6SKQ1_9ACTN|nr:GNAT family N-acetyltransferase [Actinorhabdospora filicis]GLZ77454.1 N-acetyltransferase GCN5 [Actinorhabdospora filicis]